MRAAALFVVLAIAYLASAQSPEEEEYKRKLKDYEEKKAIYDRYQAIATLPVAPSKDLVPKIPVNQIPPGYAEQLLPTYTGIPVKFNELNGQVAVPEIVVETPTVAPVTKAQRATPLRPGPQSFTDKKPASSNVSVRATVRGPSAPNLPVRTPLPVIPRRPPGLLLFTNARVSLPSVATSLGLRNAPLPTRVQVNANVPRRP